MLILVATAELAAVRHNAPVAGDWFGSSICVLDDIDGDNVPEWVASDPRGPGVVEAHSGATGKHMWSLTATRPNAYWGTHLAAVSDMNGDGIRDVVLVTDELDVPADVIVVSARDGKILLTLGRQASAGLRNACVTGGGDIDRDGAEDFLLSGMVTGDDKQVGAVSAWSTKSMKRLWQSRVGENSWRALQVASGVDFNSDGIGDIAVLGMSSRFQDQYIVLLSGADGSELCRWSASTSRTYLACVAVMTRSSSEPTVVAVLMGSHSESNNEAVLLGLQRGTSVPAWRRAIPGVSGDVELSLCAYSDSNGDGVCDLFIGNRMSGFSAGTVTAIDGAAHRELWEAKGADGSDLGACIVGGCDLDKDGHQDLLVGGFVPYNRENPGSVVALSGKSGARLYSVGRRN